MSLIEISIQEILMAQELETKALKGDPKTRLTFN